MNSLIEYLGVFSIYIIAAIYPAIEIINIFNQPKHMKKTKEYKLNDKHYAIAKIQDDEILIYIEEWKPILWGLINMPFQVSSPKAFKLSDNDSSPKHRDGVVIGGMYVGCEWEYRNMATFNLKSEIDILYASFLESLKRAENKKKRIDNFINSIY